MALNPAYRDMLIRLLIEQYNAEPEDDGAPAAQPLQERPLLVQPTIAPVGG